MSDTPETDHLEVQLGQAATHSHPILWEHSRKMERERDEAREKVNKQKKRATYNLDLAKRVRDFWEKCEKERDEAREKLDEEMKWHHRTHQELVEAQCKLLDIEYDKLKS
jgi:hypothetical protein